MIPTLGMVLGCRKIPEGAGWRGDQGPLYKDNISELMAEQNAYTYFTSKLLRVRAEARSGGAQR